MSTSLSRTRQNQAMDLAKMVAAVLVILVHDPFPGRAGEFAILISRFSVPMFLAITGYFNYGASGKTVARRLKHILKLNIAAAVFYILVNSFTAFSNGIPVREFLCWDIILPRIPALTRWAVMHVNPFSEHLWYLMAVTLCYGLLWVYVSAFGEKKVDYTPLYLIGVSFFAVLMLTAVLMPWAGMGVDSHVYRNGWLTGIPMFTLGIFLRQHGGSLRENLHLTDGKLLFAIAAGFALAICEWLCGTAGELCLGILALIPPLMLLLIGHPDLKIKSPLVNGFIAKFRGLSTGLYILHCGIISLYDLLLAEPMAAALGSLAGWVRPVAIIALSFLAAIPWEWATKQRKKA